MTRPDDGLALGLDVGGTKVALALVDATGRVHQRARIATAPERGAEIVLAAVAAAARAHFGARLDALHGVGVAVAGQVGADGVLHGAPNLGWSDVPLCDFATRAFGGGVPRRSTTCAPPRSPSGAWAPRAATPTRSPSSSARAWAAAWSRAGGCSAARAAPPGSSGTAPWSRPAPADAPAAAATPAASRRTPAAGRSPSGRARAARAAGGDAARALLALSGGAVDAIAAPHVTAAAAAGDALATHVVTETLDAVADAVVGLVNAFDPACVLFGGSVAEALPGLVPHVTAAVRTRALLPAAQEVRIARAALGNDAPVVGAALAALGPPGAR
jgi:glucokinase